MKIGGVTHGLTTDSYWDPVFAASMQAAIDMDIKLFNERFEPEKDESALHTKMANQIEMLCTKENVDGIFVSIPSERVLNAVEKCANLGIPVISINSGAEMSKSLNLLHHIGMLEYDAGFSAGEQLSNTGIKHGICINHAKGVSAVNERCQGFGDALEAIQIGYAGQVYVPVSDETKFIEAVENFVAEKLPDISEMWNGLGILAAGGPQHTSIIELARNHSNVKIGAFDTSSELYNAIDSGIKEFGIDQQPYLQGYMPVLLLTYMATTKQTVLNQFIETGPAFIVDSPTENQVICEERLFMTCSATDSTTGFVTGSHTEGNVTPSSSSTLFQTWPLCISLFSSLAMIWTLYSL